MGVSISACMRLNENENSTGDRIVKRALQVCTKSEREREGEGTARSESVSQ